MAGRRVVVLRRGCECTEVRPAMTKVAGVLMQILWDPREREIGSASQQHQNSDTVWAERASVGRRGSPVCAAESVRRSCARRVAGVSGVVKHPCAGIEGSGTGGSPETKTSLSLIALLSSARCLRAHSAGLHGVYSLPPRAALRTRRHAASKRAAARMLFRPRRAAEERQESLHLACCVASRRSRRRCATPATAAGAT